MSGENDKCVRPLGQTGEFQVHRFERGSVLGQDLNPEVVRRYRLLEFATDDRADGKPIVVRNAQSARLADDHNPNLVIGVSRPGELMWQRR